jgi:hypothetical protein
MYENSHPYSPAVWSTDVVLGALAYLDGDHRWEGDTEAYTWIEFEKAIEVEEDSEMIAEGVSCCSLACFPIDTTPGPCTMCSRLGLLQ